MPEPIPAHLISKVRAFNRFYTRKLGVLEQHLYDSPFSLTEARVLFELAQRDHSLAKEIGAELGLDAGYLSRIVQTFEDKGFVSRKPAPEDRRQQRLSLTAKGRAAFERINRRSHDDVAAMLCQLAPGRGERLVEAMGSIEQLLANEAPATMLRNPRPGDMGWVVQSHGALYAAEYG